MLVGLLRKSLSSDAPQFHMVGQLVISSQKTINQDQLVSVEPKRMHSACTLSAAFRYCRAVDHAFGIRHGVSASLARVRVVVLSVSAES